MSCIKIANKQDQFKQKQSFKRVPGKKNPEKNPVRIRFRVRLGLGLGL